MNNNNIANLQAICQVSEERAVELLGAASGSLERAVDIHFQQQKAALTSNSARVITINDDEDVDENRTIHNEGSEGREDLISKPSPSKKLRSSDSPRKQSRQISGRKQGTLHTFFGISKGGTPRKQSQTTRKDQSVSSASRATAEIQSSPINDDAEDQHPKISPKTHHGKISALPANTDSSKRTATKPNAAKDDLPSHQVDSRLSYSTLAKAFTEMTSTTKRNAKLNILKSVIMGVIEAVGGIHDEGDSTTGTNPREGDCLILTSALELISGKISLPNSDAVAPAPLQVSGAAVSSALQIVTGGVAKSRLREVYRRTGDLGDTAAEFFSPAVSVKNFFVSRKTQDRSKIGNNDGERTSQPTSQGASISRIHNLLQSVATVRQGAGSQKERQALLIKLLRLASTKEEMRFLVRTLLGNMRLGATMKSILAALAMAADEVQKGETATPQCEAIQTLQKTYDICPRLQRIALSLLCGGVEKAVQECTLEVGVPVQPMLANPAHSLLEVEKLMTKGASAEIATSSEAVAEWKYDGMRCQGHWDGEGRAKLFSRHLLDTTLQFPDAAKFMLEARKDNTVKSFIIDSEIVAVSDGAGKDEVSRLLPFQVLSSRRGTKNSEGVKIRLFVFDLLYLNGVSLLGRSLWERHELLRKSFRETPGFGFASSMKLLRYSESAISDYLSEAVSGGAEGLMVKLTGRVCCTEEVNKTAVLPSLPCPYESGTRSATWLKVKRDYVSGFADTIDVVPIGAWYGNGRKAEKGFLSPILFAVYDEDDGVFRSISRCMSFTDSMYAAIKDFYFNGTPYPADVGVSEGNSTLKPPSTVDAVKCEVDGSDDDDIDEKEDSMGKASEGEECDDDGFVRVNCFPGRPSSSLYITNESPSIWFKPSEVWEVSFADLTLSRTHTAAAGLVDDPEGRGVALRFPRFKRRRPDKSVEQATNTAQIAQLFTQQFKQC